MDGEYNTLREVKKVLAASFDLKSDRNVRNSWVSSLRSRIEGCGDWERTICCEKGEETLASPDLAPNKRSLLRNPNRRTQSTKETTGKKESDTTDFVSECMQKNKKAPNNRYVFQSLQMLVKSG